VGVVVHFTQYWWFSTAHNRRRPLRLGHMNVIAEEARSTETRVSGAHPEVTLTCPLLLP